MKEKLQQVLRKFDENELTGAIASNVLKVLKEALDDVTVLTQEEIELLINYQDEEGSFRLTNYKEYHGDVALDCYWYPSYLITLILVNLDLCGKVKLDETKMKKALDFCASHHFTGHGYDSEETQIKVATFFEKNNIRLYIEKHENITKNMSDLLDYLAFTFKRLIKENRTYDAWGTNLKPLMDEFLDCYDTVYYVAYGSNLNKEQMKKRCPSAEVVGISYINDYKLKYNLYLTIEKSIGSKVPVAIWKISNKDELSLDRYEGYPRIYRKEYIDVEVNNTVKKCLVYVMNEIEERKDVLPPKEYVERCKRGYEDFGFDVNYLEYK